MDDDASRKKQQQVEAWKKVNDMQTNGQQQSFLSPQSESKENHRQGASAAMAMGGAGSKKRKAAPFAGIDDAATASTVEVSPLKPSSRQMAAAHGAETSRDVAEESDSESRGATGMKPLTEYFMGATAAAATAPSASSSSLSSSSTGAAAAAAASAGASASSSSSLAVGVTGEAGIDTAAAGAAKAHRARAPRKKVNAGGASNVESSSSSSAASSSTDLAALQRQLHESTETQAQLDTKIRRMEADAQSVAEEMEKKSREIVNMRWALENVQRSMAYQEARRRRDVLATNCVRLGKIVKQLITSNTVADSWEEGYALKEIQKRRAVLLEKKDKLDKRKKKMQSEKNAIRRQLAKGADDTSTMKADHFDLETEESAIRMHQDALKQEESNLHEEKRVLEEEKAAHIREFKRIAHEDHSRFVRDLPALNGRFLMCMMLGRGGFSEVWKAVDLHTLDEVAVKVHELNSNWSQDRKNSYVRHVTREYNIHLSLNHPRVVRQYSVFEIDQNSFATVLEYCRGTDLDERLKREKTIGEKEAKVVLMQMISGIQYLHTPDEAARKKTIIHYDLKPANILFDENGDVKITDFGLSKQVDDSTEGTSMELTSQGAGTYYYLPPECFARDNARISTKVDVFSLGVIYYQMLFGRKPFGEGRSQERILSDGTMLNASSTSLVFPDMPKVSDEAKAFIRETLHHDYRLRPDINELSRHSYIRKK